MGTTWLEDDTGICCLIGRRLEVFLSAVFDITLALPSAFGTAGAIWKLEIALGYILVQCCVCWGDENVGSWELGVGTR